MSATVSSRWEKFIRRGFTPITRVDVYTPDDGLVFANLPISAGSIHIDRNDLVRASGSVVVPNEALYPFYHGDSVLLPDGAELVVKSGLVYPEGTEELVQMGRFIIMEGAGAESNGGVTTVSFFDRMKRLVSTDFIAPVAYGGASVFATIEAVIANQYPTVTVTFHADLDDHYLPVGTVMDKAPAEFLKDLATAIGADIYFARDGNVKVDPVPSIYAEAIPDPDWIVDTGETGIMIDAGWSISREGVFNGVVVVGTTDGDADVPPPYSFASDDDPLSFTYYLGPFGKVVTRIDRKELTTVAQCGVAARAELRNRTGLQRTLDLSMIGNCALDPGDIIKAVYANKSFETRLLDGYSYDFVSAAQSANTRAVQFVPPE